jgi:sec-independent protein translocase protein TatA
MGGLSIWHWLIVGVIVMLLFGKGRFSDLMGDVAKGMKSFKKGLAEEHEPDNRQSALRLQSQPSIDSNAPPADRPRSLGEPRG